MYLFLMNIQLKNYFFLFFSPVRKRKHRSSKHQHHQSGNVKRQKQEQSQYWTAEKKRTVGVVEPRVRPCCPDPVRIPKKHLSEDSTVLVFFLNFCSISMWRQCFQMWKAGKNTRPHTLHCTCYVYSQHSYVLRILLLYFSFYI